MARDRNRRRPKKTNRAPSSSYLAKAQSETRRRLNEWTTRKKINQPSEPQDAFQLDDWQQDALDALEQGCNVIIDAPTTAGKTRIVEAFFARNISEGQFRAVYTTPVKSLSNDKLKEFRALFGPENVGISTGDVKDNLGAPIVVATLESYRNSLLGVEPDLTRNLAIFDEYHFLQDGSRGSAWEEAIILSPDSTQILMLSASVSNPMEFCEWLEKIKKRPTKVVSTLHRPVPLQDLVFYKEAWYLAETINIPKNHPKDPLTRFPLEHEELARRLSLIPHLNLTPCIIYAGQRLACENIANRLTRKLSPLHHQASQELEDLLEKANDLFQSAQFIKAQLKKSIVRYGVAYHHSGLAPPARVAIEFLLKDGKLKFCVATMGLSIGINFAVRSAVISDYRRPGSQGFTTYAASEVLQMLGRAGRRGQDSTGFSLWGSTQAYKKFMPANRSKAQSQLRSDPSTFLGLLGRGLSLRKIERFYQSSFLKHQAKKTNFKLVQPQRLQDHFQKEVPCHSPASEWGLFKQHQDSLCQTCDHRQRCHLHIPQAFSGDLAQLHLHLHQIGCLDQREKLTALGSMGRYFPQAGGLIVARCVIDGRIDTDNLMAGVELMAALNTARFKEPRHPLNYKFPFDADDIQEELESLYPIEIFPELYDPPFGRRHYPVMREFNPQAGFIVRAWLQGENFDSLIRQVCHNKFAPGDLMAVIYRTATYVQSLSQLDHEELSDSAKSLWSELIRAPLVPLT